MDGCGNATVVAPTMSGWTGGAVRFYGLERRCVCVCVCMCVLWPYIDLCAHLSATVCKSQAFSPYYHMHFRLFSSEV